MMALTPSLVPLAPDVFCDGGVSIEHRGGNTRLTWHVMRDGERVPMVALVVPAESLHRLAQEISAAVLLVPDGHDKTFGTA